MAEKIFDNSPIEPAHPMVIRLRDDLVKIYGHIRENFQDHIDKIFDGIAREVGYVVTSTLPITIEFGDKGAVKNIEMGADHLKNTIFEKGLAQFFEKMKGQSFPLASPGRYNIYLIWFDALKLKFRTDWMEPAHYYERRIPSRDWLEPAHHRHWMEPAHFFKLPPIIDKYIWDRQMIDDRQKIRPEIPEPAHWFSPGLRIDIEEKLLITAIDEVYPELRLIDRITSIKEGLIREIGPGVREPAHYRKLGSESLPESAVNVLSELASVLKKYGF